MKNFFFNIFFRKLPADTRLNKRLRGMDSIREIIVLADLSCSADASLLKSRLEKEGKRVALFLICAEDDHPGEMASGTLITPPSLFSFRKDVLRSIEIVKSKQADLLIDLSLSNSKLTHLLVASADASLKIAASKPGNDFVDVRIVCSADSTLDERFASMIHYLNLLSPERKE